MSPRDPLQIPLLMLELQRQAFDAWLRICFAHRL